MATAQIAIDRSARALDGAFTYRVDDAILPKLQVGAAVRVKFRGMDEVGYVLSIDETQDADDLDFKTSDVLEVLSDSYFDEDMSETLLWVARKYIASLSSALHLTLPSGATPKIVHKKDGTIQIKRLGSRKSTKCQMSAVDFDFDYKRPENLTLEQQKALSVCTSAFEDKSGKCVLVDGVTGSGKTEVYLQVIEHVLGGGKNAIVLVPEIALTPQTVSRFTSRFGDTVSVIHSKLTASERKAQFWRIKGGDVRVVIGPRSALFSPLENVGVIVVDEEHESTYKQESTPRYHARDVAWHRIERSGGLLLLGSATPSIESLYRTKHDPSWQRVVLSSRASGAPLPKVELLDMSKEKSKFQSLFSGKLKRAVVDELRADNKVVLFLNKRGYASFLLCRDCGFVPMCPNCSTSLTFHESAKTLCCHHCGYEVESPAVCPKCGSPYLRRAGGGTERVERELAGVLNEAGLDDVNVIRMDSDTTSDANSHEKLLSEFKNSKRAVLLGTQIIAKGLDFDDVTLVGVINADVMMHLPDFRASERTNCLIEQVSGRAGRTSAGHVIIQTYEPDNPALRSAQFHDREMFLRVELPKRSILKYPPYVKLVNVLVFSTNENVARESARDLQNRLEPFLDAWKDAGVSLSGANMCPFEKIAKNYRWHMLIKIPLNLDISSELESFFRKYRTPNGAKIAIDVDPVSVL